MLGLNQPTQCVQLVVDDGLTQVISLKTEPSISSAGRRSDARRTTDSGASGRDIACRGSEVTSAKASGCGGEAQGDSVTEGGWSLSDGGQQEARGSYEHSG